MVLAGCQRAPASKTDSPVITTKTGVIEMSPEQVRPAVEAAWTLSSSTLSDAGGIRIGSRIQDEEYSARSAIGQPRYAREERAGLPDLPFGLPIEEGRSNTRRRGLPAGDQRRGRHRGLESCRFADGTVSLSQDLIWPISIRVVRCEYRFAIGKVRHAFRVEYSAGGLGFQSVQSPVSYADRYSAANSNCVLLSPKCFLSRKPTCTPFTFAGPTVLCFRPVGAFSSSTHRTRLRCRERPQIRP